MECSDKTKDCLVISKLYFCSKCFTGVCGNCLSENHFGHFSGKAIAMDDRLKEQSDFLNKLINEKKIREQNDSKASIGNELDSFLKIRKEKKDILKAFISKCNQILEEFEIEEKKFDSEIEKFKSLNNKNSIKENSRELSMLSYEKLSLKEKIMYYNEQKLVPSVNATNSSNSTATLNLKGIQLELKEIINNKQYVDNFQKLDLLIKLLRNDVVCKLNNVTLRIKEKNDAARNLEIEAFSPFILFLKPLDSNMKVIPNDYKHPLYSYSVNENKFYISYINENCFLIW